MLHSKVLILLKNIRKNSIPSQVIFLDKVKYSKNGDGLNDVGAMCLFYKAPK